MLDGKPFYWRHSDDEWWDEIRIVDLTPKPLLRLVTRMRYKTSGLSGDEWRTSVYWQVSEPWQGALLADAPDQAQQGWRDLDGPYHRLKSGCAAIYPGVYTSHVLQHPRMISRVEFWRKNRMLYISQFGDDQPEPRSLLVTLGHLPWALLTAREQSQMTREIFQWSDSLCFQPGCAALAVSEYRLKKRYCNDGEVHEHMGEYRRRFCQRHLRRGDGALEDADANYEVLSGPGPGEAQAWEADESKSVFGGVIGVPKALTQRGGE